ncbi:hypothetical protein SAMN05444365_103179 [Micromonospora pattaloongensis]|uniref:Hemerythrin HHE cation binding domain-containing protein n=1 Tax=Micromonospora pattaloongensis TaxID=405436 RepID=A0A1H3M0E5_9ACTN|nr:hypothetical protein [Micromonospora pattaloongensis]SDY70171.1 hypothetical protein SAMN05444365_103179 [Micromonospora pattaloongensis]
MAPGASQQTAAYAECVRQSSAADAAPTPTVALRVVRPHRTTLLGAIAAFEAALVVPAADPQWREFVGTRLHALRVAFTEHILLTEGTDGLYADLLAHAPRLARDVWRLTREHTAIAAGMSVLQHRIDSRDLSIEQLRDWADELLRALSRHRQRGADLIYDAYGTDIGGET